jgi:epoxide hydrolase-like predicted phosphatase
VPAALILDFGGVFTTDLWESIRGCSRREGLPDNRLLELLRDDPIIHPLFAGLERGEVSQSDFERRLASAAGIPSSGLLARMCVDLRPDEAMLAAVASLRASGVKIGVLSNSWGTGYFNPYQGYRLDERVDALVISDQVRLRKPEPAIFRLMLDRLGVNASDSVFVDDVAGNLPQAESMGMHVVHHVDTQKTIAELERLFAVALLHSH